MTENASSQPFKRAKLDTKSTIDDAPKLGFSDDLESYAQFKVPEFDCGITQFVGVHTGFTGVLKQRYSDFVVHEIDKQGNVVILNDLTTATDVNESEIKGEKTFDSILTEDIWAQIENVATTKSGEVLVDVSEADKEERTAVHQRVANVFPFLETNTISEGDKKFIKVTLKSKTSRARNIWPANRADWVHFTLYQENRGTFDAISLLSKQIRQSAKNFHVAGCKDKRGVSSQRVSIKRVTPESLLRVNQTTTKFQQPIAVGNISFHDEKLRLGHLKGNKFDIVIKDLKFNDEKDIEESINSLKSKGFINYFGTQRFGFKHVSSPEVGLEILRKNWEKVIDLLLSERPKDIPSPHGHLPSFNESIRTWKKTKDAKEVFKHFSWKFLPEGVIFNALSKLSKHGQSNNFQSALFALPRNNRTMYMHAYQSLIWNKLASFRFQEYGMQVVPGDLLLFGDEENNYENEGANEENEETNEDNKVTKMEPVFADETNIHKASIYNVVLPVPGTSVLLPKNYVQDKLKELLAEDGLTIDTFKEMSREFILHGAYRKLMQIPKDFSWSLHPYEDEKVQLITTDLQLSQNINCEPPKTGNKRLVKLSMSLPPSTYATVVIRELFKKDLIPKID